MKIRYALEHGFGSDPPGTVYLCLLDENNDIVGGMDGSRYASEDAAKADCEEGLQWKPAPENWQPDTYLVSSWFVDEGWDR